MKKDFEKKYHELEQNHWWFVARRDMIVDLLKNEDRNSKILDVGCSGGNLMLDLKKAGFNNLIGIDLSKDAIDLCKKNALNCFLMDATNVKLKEKFDIVIASDIIEHIKDDNAALKSWKNVLKPNGKIICFVPAFKFLWSNHDVLNNHFRRYNSQTLGELFVKNHLSVKRISYWNFTLFIPAALIRIFLSNSKLSKNQLNKSSNFVNNLLKNLVFLENKLLRVFNFPFGISVFIIAQNNSFK